MSIKCHLPRSNGKPLLIGTSELIKKDLEGQILWKCAISIIKTREIGQLVTMNTM